MSSTHDAGALEQRALRLSIFGYVFMAALGITFAVLTSSEAILLDGVYSLISFGAAIVSRRVARLVDRPGSETFHFGYAHFEPIVNAVRGVFILGIAAFALFSAVSALFHGGRPLVPGLAVIYGVSAAAGCLFMAWSQRRKARRVGSPTLEVDARNWFVDGMLSVGAALTFVVALILERSGRTDIVPYVDPVLVTVIVLAIVRVPLRTVRDNLWEVLQVAPAVDEQAEVRRRVEGALEGLPARETHLRLVKVGRFFYVLAHVLLPEEHVVGPVKELDDHRMRVTRALSDIDLRLIVDVVFTAHEPYVHSMDDRVLAADVS